MVAVKAALVAVKRAVLPENLPLKLFGAGSGDAGLILSAIPEDSYLEVDKVGPAILNQICQISTGAMVNNLLLKNGDVYNFGAEADWNTLESCAVSIYLAMMTCNDVALHFLLTCPRLAMVS
jgi:hypothetical protein